MVSSMRPHRPNRHCALSFDAAAPVPTAVRRALLATGVALGGVLAAWPLHAANTPATSPAAHDFDVPAGPLAAALSSVAASAGINVTASPALVHGKHTTGLRGRYGVADGLNRLLMPLALQAVLQADGSYVLAAIPEASAPVLSAVTVSGKAPGSTTEGTGSYTTWSTSSSTRLNLTPQETPQSISVVTRQRMDDQGLHTLNDVLDAATGISVKSLGVGGDGPQLWARGASITNFQVDGVSSSTSMSNYLQSSAIYDRVEVVKGATGMMSGLGTPSATVNLIRKRPTAVAQTSLSVEAGNWSRYGVGLDVSRALNDDASVRARLVADYKRQGAWVSNYRQDYGVLYGIGEIDLSARTLLTLGFSHIERNTDSSIRPFFVRYSNGQPTGAKLSDYAAPDWTYYDHRHDSVFGSVEHTFGSGWAAKAELTHARYEYDAMLASLLGTVDQITGAGARAQMPRWASEAEQTSLDTYVTGPFSLFGRRHELIGGITLSHVDQDSPGYSTVQQNISDIFSWRDTTAKPTFTRTGEVRMQEQQYGAYLSTRLQLSDATSLLLGGRITDWRRDRTSESYASGSVEKTRDRERNVVIPYAGIVHALNDTYSVYASYTKIFNPQGYWVRDINDMPLDPEEGTSYETGVKASFDDGALTASLSLFRTQQDTLAQWDSVQRVYEAVDDTATEGVEVELAGELAHGWQVSAGYTYSETRDKQDQRIMTRIPRNTVKLFTTYRLPAAWSRFTLGGGVNWESETSEGHTQGSYALVNLMARYEVNRQLAISAHVNNALDKRYFVALGGIGGTYGSPRNFMVSAKYRF